MYAFLLGLVVKMKVFTLITGFLTVLAFQGALAGDTSSSALMDCRDNYFSTFSAKLKDGKIYLHFEAVGYADHLEIADKLGLPAEKKFSILEFSVPQEKCRWGDSGRLSCASGNTALVFKNSRGEVEGMTASQFSLNTGDVGFGSASYRRVELNLEADQVVSDSKGYRYCY